MVFLVLLIELHYKEVIKFMQEVCSGCHSVQHLSYRNLSEKGGPEFSIEEVKANSISI